MLFGVRVLTTCPLTCFTKALTQLREHADRESHRSAGARATESLNVMNGDQPKVHKQIDKTLADRILSHNREKLESIVKVMILCGRHRYALRGDKDTSNHGNLWALIDFKVEVGDQVLAEHIFITCHLHICWHTESANMYYW